MNNNNNNNKNFYKTLFLISILINKVFFIWKWINIYNHKTTETKKIQSDFEQLFDCLAVFYHFNTDFQQKCLKESLEILI